MHNMSEKEHTELRAFARTSFHHLPGPIKYCIRAVVRLLEFWPRPKRPDSCDN